MLNLLIFRLVFVRQIFNSRLQSPFLHLLTGWFLINIRKFVCLQCVFCCYICIYICKVDMFQRCGCAVFASFVMFVNGVGWLLVNTVLSVYQT